MMFRDCYCIGALKSVLGAIVREKSVPENTWQVIKRVREVK
jgi:hypothetical protein